jgi:hypothetical protein
MAGEGELTGDVQYGLHSLISDLQADSALLCIALGGLQIMNGQDKASLNISILKLQCESVVNDYAAHWLQNPSNTETSEHDTLENLSYMSEDLEGIGELFDLAMNCFENNDIAARLMKILSVQAKAHALITDEFYNVLSANISYESLPERKIWSFPEIFLAAQDNDNEIVPFGSKTA